MAFCHAVSFLLLWTQFWLICWLIGCASVSQTVGHNLLVGCHPMCSGLWCNAQCHSAKHFQELLEAASRLCQEAGLYWTLQISECLEETTRNDFWFVPATSSLLAGGFFAGFLGPMKGNGVGCGPGTIQKWLLNASRNTLRCNVTDHIVTDSGRWSRFCH